MAHKTTERDANAAIIGILFGAAALFLAIWLFQQFMFASEWWAFRALVGIAEVVVVVDCAVAGFALGAELVYWIGRVRDATRRTQPAAASGPAPAESIEVEAV